MLTKEQAIENLGLEEITKREQAEMLWKANRDAHKAYADRWNTVLEQLESQIDDDPSVAPLKASADAAQDAWQDFEGLDGELHTTTVHDGDGEIEVPIRCRLTGLVMAEGDDVLFDAYGNPIMLQSAAGIPHGVFEDDEAASEAA